MGTSVLWASWDLGSEKPDIMGVKIAWGETQTKGAFKAGVKGNNAVYAYQVLNIEKNKDAKFDVNAEKAQLVQMSLRYLGNYTHDLYKKADIVDNRYLFY